VKQIMTSREAFEPTLKLVDATVISEVTGLPKSTIWRASREKKIPCYKYGNRYRYDRREVLASLKKNQTGLPSEAQIQVRSLIADDPLSP
jgi:excisionase family DNA binding protein